MFAVTPYDLSILEGLPTRRLLGYLRRLRRCQESLEDSDITAGQPREPDYRPIDRIYFKDDPRWAEHVTAVKALLRERGHVTRRASSKPRRKKAQGW